MPAKHSKNSGSKHHLTYNEKRKTGLGSVKQLLGNESQLPFGYCCLSMHPAVDPVVTPSGHVYSREFIIEYLLTKSKDLKLLNKAYEEQQAAQRYAEESKGVIAQEQELNDFIKTQDDVSATSASLKRKVNDYEGGDSLVPTNNSKTAKPDKLQKAYQIARKNKIDDTEKEDIQNELSRISPWVPQFTPHAADATLSAPPKRPSSPFSGQPLRAKDLIPIELIPESGKESDANSSVVRYLCPVSRKTITNQKVVLIKKTRTLMIQQVAETLAYPTMTCPVTSKPFKIDDVLELQQATSGFSSTGKIEAKVHRPSNN